MGSSGSDQKSSRYFLRLFVAGDEPNSMAAKASLDKICANYPPQDCEVEIVDILQDPRRAREENVLITPALVIQGPRRRVVLFGNLADPREVLAALQEGTKKV